MGSSGFRSVNRRTLQVQQGWMRAAGVGAEVRAGSYLYREEGHVNFFLRAS